MKKGKAKQIINMILGFLIILFIFIMLMGSTMALHLYNSFEFTFTRSISSIIRFLSARFFPLAFLALIVFLSYRIIPMEPPKWKYIIPGAIACMALHGVFSAGFSLLIGPDRYNLLYGALGMLFVLLVNVYFFFTFFLFGAQLIMVQSSSDILLFIRFRKLRSKGTKLIWPWDKLFASLPVPLKKYSSFYRKGEVVFNIGSQGLEVYYILSGNAGVYLDAECLNRIAIVGETQFFGEMELAVSEGRSASIKAETDLSVIIFPRDLFRCILQTDPDTGQNLI